MKIIIFLITFFSLNFLYGQSVTFQKLLGSNGVANKVIECADGGFMVLADIYYSSNRNIKLIKLNANGDSVWTKSYGGLSDDEGKSINQTNDGGFIVAGATSSFGSGGNNMYLLKTDSLGNLQWSRTYGESGDDLAMEAEQTYDNGYLLVGRSNSFGNFYQSYIVRTDSVGYVLWSKTSGGNDIETANSFEQTNDSGFVIVGSSLSFGSDIKIYLFKMDKSGVIIWSEIIGSLASNENIDINRTIDDGFIITATKDNGGLPETICLIKISIVGNIEWSSEVTTGNSQDITSSSDVKQTFDGGYILGGQLNTDCYLARTDSTGALLWAKTYGLPGFNFINSVEETSDGGFIAAGSLLVNGVTQIFLIKTDSAGNSNCNENVVTSITNTITTLSTTVLPNDSSVVTLLDTAATLININGPFTTYCSNVSIREISGTEQFHIFPNPSNGNFRFESDNFIENGQIEIFNLFGSIYYQNEIVHQRTLNFNFSNLNNGLYFLRITDKMRTYYSHIVIQD